MYFIAASKRLNGPLKNEGLRGRATSKDYLGRCPWSNSSRLGWRHSCRMLPDVTVIVDAKYKEHWEEMQRRRWTDLEEELRERHRADLLQVLAYSTVAQKPKVLVCLAYPCNEKRWLSLQTRNLLLHRASLPLTQRRVDLVLVAFPLSTRLISEAVTLMAEEIRRLTA